jgi:hypothetical protein
VLLACGLRRHEAVELNFSHLQQREQHWPLSISWERQVTFGRYRCRTGSKRFLTFG